MTRADVIELVTLPILTNALSTAFIITFFHPEKLRVTESMYYEN